MKKKISIVALWAVVSCGFSPALIAEETMTATVTANKNETPQFSPGLDDVVHLTKAGVSESVIVTYVQSSGVMYRPSASELVQLRDAGVSPQVTAAMIQRGGEIRQTALAQQTAAQTAAQTAHSEATYNTAATYSTAPTTAAPTTGGSTVTYIGYNSYPASPYYGYCGRYYPRYYSSYPRYYSCYPGYYSYYPVVGFRVGGHHHSGHH